MTGKAAYQFLNIALPYHVHLHSLLPPELTRIEPCPASCTTALIDFYSMRLLRKSLRKDSPRLGLINNLSR